jgi:NAD(P)-dependent dehydrogenase (short-subunit alcohol dehydrogenase family)
VDRAYVVTGSGRGVGRAIAERLLDDGGAVVALDLDPDALAWTWDHPAGGRAVALAGSAADEAVVERAAELAEAAGTLTGWVNNAAVFRDATVGSAPTATLLELIGANLAPAVVGSATAVRRFLAAGTAGSIVNVSSHQAQRPVPGCLPYATAKAAIEGLTRALAVDHGGHGIRVNAVALGSVRVERHDDLMATLDEATVARFERELREVHPLERMGDPREVAATVAWLLSDQAGFVSGATIPVDGGRAALGRDPQV